MNVHIEREEVKSIIESIPWRKHTGTDKIATELLECMGNQGINLMNKIFNDCDITGGKALAKTAFSNHKELLTAMLVCL